MTRYTWLVTRVCSEALAMTLRIDASTSSEEYRVPVVSASRSASCSFAYTRLSNSSASYVSMLMTTMSPTPFFVRNTGSPLSCTSREISANLLRRSDMGRMLCMTAPQSADALAITIMIAKAKSRSKNNSLEQIVAARSTNMGKAFLIHGSLYRKQATSFELAKELRGLV